MDSADAEGTLGDKMDDWLWDLEDRYDLGAVGDHFAKNQDAVSDDPRLANVRRYRRSNNGVEAVEGVAGVDEADPAEDMTVVNAAMYEPRPHAPVRRPPRQRRQIRGRALAAASLVVIGLGGVAMAATRSRGSGRSGEPNVAIGTPTSKVAVLVGPPGVSVPRPPGTNTPSTPPVGIPAQSGQPSEAIAPNGAALTPTGNAAGGRTTQSATPGPAPAPAPGTITTPTAPPSSSPPASTTTAPTTTTAPPRPPTSPPPPSIPVTTPEITDPTLPHFP